MAQPDPEAPIEASPAGTTPSGEAPRAAAERDDLATSGAWAEDELPEDELDYDDEDGEPTETVDEQGRRHVRRAAPEGTEELLEKEAPRHTGLPDAAERWRVRSATGTVLTAFAMGLQQVFEPERNQPAIIMETSGEPPEDLPVEAELAQLGPRQSSITVRSWLLGKPSKQVPMAPQATDDKTHPADSESGPAQAGN